jgi:hypothetical protein
VRTSFHALHPPPPRPHEISAVVTSSGAWRSLCPLMSKRKPLRRIEASPYGLTPHGVPVPRSSA